VLVTTDSCAALRVWLRAFPKPGQHKTAIQRIDCSVSVLVGSIAIRITRANWAAVTSGHETCIERIHRPVAVGVAFTRLWLHGAGLEAEHLQHVDVPTTAAIDDEQASDGDDAISKRSMSKSRKINVVALGPNGVSSESTSAPSSPPIKLRKMNSPVVASARASFCPTSTTRLKSSVAPDSTSPSRRTLLSTMTSSNRTTPVPAPMMSRYSRSSRHDHGR